MKQEYLSFYQRGKEDVLRFVLDFMPFIEKNVSEIHLPTVDQDRIEHWDIELCGSSNIKIDVKGLKKINRSDNSYNDASHWVELVGNAGFDGWLKGQAKFIVIECVEFWLLVDRIELLNLAEHLTVNGKIVYESREARGNLYQRAKWGNKDQTTIVYRHEIETLSKTKRIDKKGTKYVLIESVQNKTYDIFVKNSDGFFEVPNSFIK